VKLKLLLLAGFIVFGSVNALADDSEWRTSWDGILHVYASSAELNQNSVINPGNNMAKLTQRTDAAEARLNFKMDNDSLRFSARPILRSQHYRNVFGDTRQSDVYFSQWQARWKAGETLALSGGRELLNWGPAQFRSLSNPFYFNNGRSNPMAELSGMDTIRLSWSPDVSKSVYVARIFASGYGHPEPDPWSDSWLLKADWRGGEGAVGFVLAKQSQASLFVGAHAQETIADAWLLYSEASSYTLQHSLGSPEDVNRPFIVSAESPRRTDVLAGASYTFDNGQTLYVEYLRYDHGFSAAENHAYFSRVRNAASAFPAGNSIPVLSTVLTSATQLLGRDYLYLVWQTNLMESTGFSRMMFTHNMTDDSNELSGYSEYTVNPHLSVFGQATLNSGGAQREFAQLYDRMLALGVKVVLP
jgi:hypothetical protein